jgi:hypothetical protein
MKRLYFLSNFSTLDLVDRERLSSCLMTLIRKHNEVHQRRQKRLEPVVFVLAETGIEERFDSSDDSSGGHGSLRGWSGKKLLSMLVEAPREFVQEFDTSPNGSGAGGTRLDDQRPSGVGLAGRELQHRFEAEAHPVTPDVASPPRGRLDFLAQARGTGVKGGKEAVFFVGEVLIEGGAGNAGAIDHVLDVGFQVSEFRGGVEHRYDQPLALDRLDQVGRELPNSRREFAAAVGQQFERRLHLLRWPVITDRSKKGVRAQLYSIEGHRETHKFVLKTMKVFSRYQNKGGLRIPLWTAAISQPALIEVGGGYR